MGTSVYDIGLDKKIARALIRRKGIRTKEELIEYYHRYGDDINCLKIDYYITSKALDEIKKIILENDDTGGENVVTGTSLYTLGLSMEIRNGLILKGLSTKEDVINYYHEHDDDITCFLYLGRIVQADLTEIKEKILGIKIKKNSTEKSRWGMVNRLNEINVQRARHCLEGFTDVWCSKYVRTGKIELRCEECSFWKEEGSCSIAHFIKEHNKEVEL